MSNNTETEFNNVCKSDNRNNKTFDEDFINQIKKLPNLDVGHNQ